MSNQPEKSSPYQTTKLEPEHEEEENASPYKTKKLEAEEPEGPSPYETVILKPEEPAPSPYQTIKIEPEKSIPPVGPPETDAPPPSEPPAEGTSRAATWWHLPRRIIILAVAFGLTLALLAVLRQPYLNATGTVPPSSDMDWSISWATLQPVSEMLRIRRPTTLRLVGLSLGLTLILSIPTVLIALLVNAVEKRAGPLGSILKATGKLWTSVWSAVPAFGLGLVMLYLLAIQLELIPLAGGAAIEDAGRLRRLLLPATVLALLPTLLSSQVVARYLTLIRDQPRGRVVLAALLNGIGTLLSQIGGVLSAAVGVEAAFNLPGLGRLIVQAAGQMDPPVLFGVLRSYAILILIFRIASELLLWLERILRVPPIEPQPERTRWGKIARGVWVAVTILALLLPLGALIAGFTVSPERVTATDPGAINAPPSAEHPWGADRLGRDLQARILRGSTVTFGTAGLIALAALIPSVLGGALLGYLEAKEKVWSEWLADLLFLPATVPLFFPVVAGALFLSLAFRSQITTGIVIFLLLLPRATRAVQALWVAAPERKRSLVRWLAGPAVALLGTLFAGIWALPAVEFLGFGPLPPTPSLGGTLGENMMMLFRGPQGLFIATAFLWISAFTLYLAVDAVAGFFNSKEALARLNE